MEKLYGLKILRKGSEMWGECYVFSHSIDKLVTISQCNSWRVGSHDITNAPSVVRYSSNYNTQKLTAEQDCYEIVEVPFVI